LNLQGGSNGQSSTAANGGPVNVTGGGAFYGTGGSASVTGGVGSPGNGGAVNITGGTGNFVTSAITVWWQYKYNWWHFSWSFWRSNSYRR
jgi:hypothetical protein